MLQHHNFIIFVEPQTSVNMILVAVFQYDIFPIYYLKSFQVLDDILEGQIISSELTRIMISVNALRLSTYALNDILVAHPCPASLSRFSFR